MADRDIFKYHQDIYSRPGIRFPIDVLEPKQRIEAYLESYKVPEEFSIQGFDDSLMRDNITVVSACGPPNTQATFELAVTPSLCNRIGNMHGGAIALVFDMCTTMSAAPVARSDFWWFGGVSRTLNTTYLRPIIKGTCILIECEVLQVGTRLATIRGAITDKLTGNLLAVAEHNKVSIDLRPKGKL